LNLHDFTLSVFNSLATRSNMLHSVFCNLSTSLDLCSVARWPPQSEFEPAMGARMLRFVEKANERADLAR
jgi:hypothetical protein